MAFIEIENLSLVYNGGEPNEHKALDGINLAVERGEFVALLGANGSGKSTLSRVLNGLLLPTEGVCRVDGVEVTRENLPKLRRKVGMVFQNPDNQIIAATVEADAAFGAENLGLAPNVIRQRVDAALKAVGMTRYKNHAPHLLSGGQKQRVAIAGALVMEPSCLVLDEPTAMLDPEGRGEVAATIAKLRREKNITVVLITHFMEEAAAADRPNSHLRRRQNISHGRAEGYFFRYGIFAPFGSCRAAFCRHSRRLAGKRA